MSDTDVVKSGRLITAQLYPELSLMRKQCEPGDVCIVFPNKGAIGVKMRSMFSVDGWNGRASHTLIKMPIAEMKSQAMGSGFAQYNGEHGPIIVLVPNDAHTSADVVAFGWPKAAPLEAS